MPEEKNFLVTLDKGGKYVCFIALDMESYEKSGHKKVKCSISAEIPPDSKKTSADFLEYVTPLIKDYFKKNIPGNHNFEVNFVKESKKNKISKDKLKSQSFGVKVMKATNTAIEENGRYLMLAGDTVRSPVYHFGHGLNDAFKHAKWFGQVLSGQMTIQEYRNSCRSNIMATAKKAAGLNSLKRPLFAEFAEKKIAEDLKARNTHRDLTDMLYKIGDRLKPLSDEMKQLAHIKDSMDLAYEESPEIFLKKREDFEKQIDELGRKALLLKR